MQKTEDLELKALGQFIGTQQYYRVWLGALATEGVKYVMDNGYSWFVTNALSVIKTMPKLKREAFLTVELKRIPACMHANGISDFLVMGLIPDKGRL